MTDMAQHFSWSKLLKFVLPSIAMMIFTSTYSIVDGFFVSNFAGKTAFAAVNLVIPLLMVLGTVGFMVGSGGSAIIANSRGKGDNDGANRQFSLLVYFAIAVGLAFSAVGMVVIEPFSRAFGAEGELLKQCVLYGRICLAGMVLYILQFVFQTLFITAGKPNLGFAVTAAAGVTNIVLDAVLVGALGWGAAGAAIATVAGNAIGGLFPLVYFARPNSSALRLGRTSLEWRVIGKACVNGSSELMSNIAFSVVGMLYNMQLMTMLGEDGVAAYGIIMYVGMIFNAIFMGYAVGAAPLMSFNQGACNTPEMQSLWRKGIAFMAFGGIAMLAASQACAAPLAHLFASYDANLESLTVHAFHLYAWSFLLMGFSIYGSSLFTSLGSGLISALISFLRTLVFETAAVLYLPTVMGADGIWLSVVVAELAAFTLSWGFMLAFGRHFGYLPKRR